MKEVSLVLAFLVLAGCADSDAEKDRGDRRLVGMTATYDPPRFVPVTSVELGHEPFSVLADALASPDHYASTAPEMADALQAAIVAKWQEKYGEPAPGFPTVQIGAAFYEVSYVS